MQLASKSVGPLLLLDPIQSAGFDGSEVYGEEFKRTLGMPMPTVFGSSFMHLVVRGAELQVLTPASSRCQLDMAIDL